MSQKNLISRILGEMSNKSYENLSDEQVMALYKKGTVGAFECLYNRHQQKIYGFIYSKTSNTEKTADIFQEVFMRLHNSKHLYKDDYKFLPWIFTLTKNLIIDHQRKNAKAKNSVALEEIPELAAPEGSPAPVTPEWDKAFEQIPATQRKALELRYFEEKSFQEISLVLETSEVNVRKMISRGLQKVKSIFKEGGHHE